ncbi:hypothetical protein SAMN05421781_0309 [Marinococcus luteus]|uniref:site-specific DNA-methyltransferase (cytosine-N(4)-specific) n=1 Tax=Marinococcus luteus TaxID=1122204 RepID=A0A1H2QGJ2_9BACI|nr:hypothetical protein [Marinococcus luteus]SDW06205.1 hypothetical protein SAMN05421781_0309 [Marinococcus luteus]
MALSQQLDLFKNATPNDILPTNQTTKNSPVHRWFNFVAGFSPEFVEMCITDSNLSKNSTLLDPFGGCGTSLVESNFHGINSVGFEAHLFLAKISDAKISIEIKLEVINEIYNEMKEIDDSKYVLDNDYSNSAKIYLLKLIPEYSLNKLALARKLVDSYTGNKHKIAHLVLSKMLDLCSHSKTDGIYKAPTSKKNALEYYDSLNSIYNLIYDDLNFIKEKTPKNKAKIIKNSSEDMSFLRDNSCDLLVTSPPYINNFDFGEMTRMYLYFWLYASSWGEITDKVRTKLVTNTTTALKGHKEKIPVYRSTTPISVHKQLDLLERILKEKAKTKPSKKPYHNLIYPYFSQMSKIFNESHRVLKNNSKINIIISDAALYGIHIKAHDILASILAEIGYDNIEVIKLRDRGARWILEKREGAKEGLGEYLIQAKVKK